MVKVYEFLANGFEEIEGLAPIDIFRRAGLDARTVSVTGSEFVESSHGVTVKADLVFETAGDFADADLLMIPGGMPGAKNLNAHEGVRKALRRHFDSGKLVAAICAAPAVLASLGILDGKRATCSPGWESHFGATTTYTGALFEQDGTVVTGEGPAATLPYAYHILSLFVGEEKTRALEKKMQYAHLMNA